MEKQIDFERMQRAARRRKGAVRALTYTLLSLWAVMVLFPFYWMLLTSFKEYGAYNAERIPPSSPCRPPCKTIRTPSPPCPLAATWPTR